MGNSCMIVNAGKVQECVCGWLKTYSGLGEWEPHSVSAIYGITPGKEEQWACVINEKKQRNALWSTKISDGFGPMSSQNLKRDLTDPSGPRGWKGHNVREFLHSRSSSKRMYCRRKDPYSLCKHSFKTSLLNAPFQKDHQPHLHWPPNQLLSTGCKTSRLKDKS